MLAPLVRFSMANGHRRTRRHAWNLAGNHYGYAESVGPETKAASEVKKLIRQACSAYFKRNREPYLKRRRIGISAAEAGHINCDRLWMRVMDANPNTTISPQLGAEACEDNSQRF
jgi:hypothetical protein